MDRLSHHSAHQWIVQSKLEAKLIFKNWFLLALPFLYGIWLVSHLSSIAPPISQDLYMYMYDFHKIQHTLSLGVAMLLGILLIRRDIQRSSYDWFASLPVSSGTWILTKFIVGLLYLSLFTVMMSLVYIVFAFQREVPIETIMEHTVYFALQYEWSYAVTLALAMFLAVIIPNKVSYLIGFCAWMFGTFFLDIFIISRNNLYFLKTFHLNQFITTSLIENEVWGQGITNIENGLSRIFVFSFIVLLLVGMILLLKKQRPTVTLKRWTIITLAGFVGCAALFAPYGWMWKDRYNVYAERRVDPFVYEDMVITTFQMDGYDIDIERTKNNLLKVTANMQFPTEETPVEQPVQFTLNQAFHIQNLLLNGEEISFIREGDLFIFDHSEMDPTLARQTLSVEYEGTLYEWGYDYLAEYVSAFVQDENVFLPSFVAWYPLPGNQPLFVDSPDYVIQNPTDFRVAFKGFDPLYGTLNQIENEQVHGNLQVFEGEQVEEFYVFSGQLMEVKSPNDSFKVITSPSNTLEAEYYLQDILDMKGYFKGWLGDDFSQIDQVVYFPLSLIGNFYNRNINKVMGNSFLIAQSRHHNLDRYQRSATFNAMLFKDDQMGSFFSEEESEAFSLISEVRQLIMYMYYRDHLQMNHEEIIEGRRTPGLYFLYRQGHPAIGMTHKVDQAISDGKTEQVKEVLKTFYDMGLTITNQRESTEYAKITLDDWQRVWDEVMNDE